MAIYRDASLTTSLVAGAGPHIEVLYRVVGRGTTLRSEMVAGQSVSIVGPLGRGFSLGKESGEALLVGGGTGIASLYELAAALVRGGRGVTVLLGARSELDLIGREDFEGLDVELVCTTEDGSLGETGLVTAPLRERLASAPEGSCVYACGPTPMMRAAADLAENLGVRCYVSLENPMACGFGVCLGCAAPRREGGFALVCRQGPVFDASEIAWEGLP
jgi:dihydroorotate dehydrogenase electron transfer subunit